MRLRTLIGMSVLLIISGCASVPLKEGGTLKSYSQLGPAKGDLTRSRTFVDPKGLASVKTVSIRSTIFSPSAALRIKKAKDRTLVANAIDRALCVSLSDRYRLIPYGQPADLTVRSVVTDIVPTDKALAGLSTAVSLGSSAALPIGIPRLPLGLGGLAVEAEAVDNTGEQRGAIVWSKGANSFTTNARISDVGDAYSLATTFGKNFSRLLVTGKETTGLDVSLPSAQQLNSALGGKSKYMACEAFGRSPGILGVVADKIGAPPEWTDKSSLRLQQ